MGGAVEDMWQATFDVENTMQHLSCYPHKDERADAVWVTLQENWTELLAALSKVVGHERPPEWDIDGAEAAYENRRPH